MKFEKYLTTRSIYCVECGFRVLARLTNGLEIYPHRPDLESLPFWKCDTCDNYVGCHHKTKNRTRPLGVIPNQRVREWRPEIHSLLDPLWRSKKIDRAELYSKLSERLGRTYHTAELRTPKECEDMYLAIVDIKNGLEND